MFGLAARRPHNYWYKLYHFANWRLVVFLCSHKTKEKKKKLIEKQNPRPRTPSETTDRIIYSPSSPSQTQSSQTLKGNDPEPAAQRKVETQEIDSSVAPTQHEAEQTGQSHPAPLLKRRRQMAMEAKDHSSLPRHEHPPKRMPSPRVKPIRALPLQQS